MSISGVGAGFGAAQALAKTQDRQEAGGNFVLPELPGSGKPVTYSAAEIKAMRSINDAVEKFTDYMKMTPAERMQYAWLAQHGVSREEFDAMSPEDQKKLMDQMKQEIEFRIKKQAEDMAQKSAGKIFS